MKSKLKSRTCQLNKKLLGFLLSIALMKLKVIVKQKPNPEILKEAVDVAIIHLRSQLEDKNLPIEFKGLADHKYFSERRSNQYD